MNISQIDELARLGESRTYEFKESISWKNDHVKLKVTKSIMAMSNVRDGGMILGIKERADTFDPVGMSESDANTFRHDDMADHVGKYAHPSIDFSINRVTDKERVFIVIKISQFLETPIICEKDYYFNNKVELRGGDIFTRTSTRKYESSRVMNHIDLREILELAIDQGVKMFVRRAYEAGLSGPLTGTTLDEDLFNKQIKDLL